MSGPPSPEIVQCPHCWVENPAIEERCRACGKALAIFIGPRKPVRKIGLGALMLLIALTAVCLAAMRVSPGLGIFLLILVVPALARMLIGAARRADDERPMTLEQKIGLYFASMGLMLGVSLAAFVAFVATCVPAGFVVLSIGNGSGFIVACAIGAVAPIVVSVLLLRRFWPMKD